MSDIKVISKQNGVAIILPSGKVHTGDPDGDFVAEAGSITGYIRIKRDIDDFFVVKEISYTNVKDSSGATIGTSSANCVSVLNSEYFNPASKIQSIDNVNFQNTIEAGQVLAFTDQSGSLKVDNIEYHPKTISEDVKNVSGGTLTKGTPVHVTGSTGNLAEVVAADAATNYPAHFILNEDLADDGEGKGIALGFINNVDVPDASIYSEGQTVYLGASGGFVTSKPTGTNAIQNLGVIIKVNTSTDKISGIIMGAGRSNDVPNIPDGQTWIGNSSGVATPTTLAAVATSGAYSDLTGAPSSSANMENSKTSPSTVGAFNDGARLLTGHTSASITAGNLVNMTGAGASNVGAQSANAAATGMLLMATDAANSNELLIEGVVKLSTTTTTSLMASNAKVGTPLYMSTTAGAVQTAAPSTSGDIVRVVGHVLNATDRVIYFNPSVDWIEL